MKKSILVLVIVFSFSFISKAANNINDVNDTNDCQMKIKQLERIIESLQKRFDCLTTAYNELKEENEQLKASLPNGGTATDTKGADFALKNDIVYKGKKRDLRWFNYMYNNFKDKIICIDGNYVYVNFDLKNVEEISSKPHQSGEIVSIPKDAMVFQVLNDEEVILEKEIVSPRGGGTSTYGTFNKFALDRIGGSGGTVEKISLYFHVKGCKNRLVEKQLFPYKGYLVSNGIYTSSSGKRNIQSFILYETLSKEQFANALNRGFVLKKRTTVGGKIVETIIP